MIKKKKITLSSASLTEVTVFVLLKKPTELHSFWMRNTIQCLQKRQMLISYFHMREHVLYVRKPTYTDACEIITMLLHTRYYVNFVSFS